MQKVLLGYYYSTIRVLYRWYSKGVSWASGRRQLGRSGLLLNLYRRVPRGTFLSGKESSVRTCRLEKTGMYFIPFSELAVPNSWRADGPRNSSLQGIDTTAGDPSVKKIVNQDMPTGFIVETFHGTFVLEIPKSNETFEGLAEYTKLAMGVIKE